MTTEETAREIVRNKTLNQLVTQVYTELAPPNPDTDEDIMLLAADIAHLCTQYNRAVSMAALLICVSSGELEAETIRQKDKLNGLPS